MHSKILAIIVLVCFLFGTVACGNGMNINGSYHDTVGLATLNQKDPDVCYEVIFGNVVWSVLLFSTVIAPIYFLGWSIMEPVADTRCPYDK